MPDEFQTVTTQCHSFGWVGWYFLWAALFVMLFGLARQFVLLSRNDQSSNALSEKLSVMNIALGWFVLMVTIGMTWHGLSSTWTAIALYNGDPQTMLLCYAELSISASLGLLIWAFGYFQEALFRGLWKRKEIKILPHPNP